MAKELPYFRFYPSEYLTGDITLCDEAIQGLFIQVCCYYWMKDCSISLANAKQRFSNCLSLLEQLLKQNILKVDSKGNIIIEFLDEQMNEFIDVSGKRAIAGRKGGIAKAKQMLSKRIAKANIEEKSIDKYIYDKFYDEQIIISNLENNLIYPAFVEWLFKNNPNKAPLKKILAMKNQITFDRFNKLTKEFGHEKVKTKILAIENNHKKYDSLNLTLTNWLKGD